MRPKEFFQPSIREIGKKFGINSPNGVECHLRALEKKGFIKRGKNSSRSIQILKHPVKAQS